MKHLIPLITVVGLCFSITFAATPENRPGTTTIAVASLKGGTEADRLGDFVFEVLQSELAARPGFELVDRERLVDVLSEQKLGASGLTGEKAAQVGRLIGAEYYVFGNCLWSGEHGAINCRVVQVESGVLQPILIPVVKDEDPLVVGRRLAEQTKQAIEKLSGRATDTAKNIVAPFAWPDGLARPVLAYRIPETSATAATVRPDPAAEKALEGYYFDHGFKAVQLSRPSQGLALSGIAPVPALHLEGPEHETLLAEARSKGVDVIVLGLAVSDRATRIGPFAAARARVEFAAVDTHTSKVLATANGYGTGTDLSEFVAEKKAIASATEQLLVSFTQKIAASLAH